ncbi:MAG: PD40 domain-containing protein [Leptospiraceae bacterium]|nr:PD40 domain-containing protein [Leptospiraceae bacterium]
MKFYKIIFPLLFFFGCSLIFYRSSKIKPNEFDYDSISKAHYTSQNENPYPLTVKRGDNLYNSTTEDGRYLFFASNDNGNFDIFFRDLKSSIVVPVTNHPASALKPAISPKGDKLVYVSEQFDSEGDLILMDMNPKKWVDAYLKGDMYINEDFQVLTNPHYGDPSKIERIVDTDPDWSGDGRYIVFSTERFTPGLPNLAIIDTQNKNKIKQLTTKGGVKACFSSNNKTVYYLSFKDHPLGEIYSLDISTKQEKRLTNDNFMDFGPSVNPDDSFLYYSSVQNDTNKNGRLDERDNNFIIQLDLKTGKTTKLTAGNLSIFDVEYSAMNNGSLFFSASLDNAINIYFIPLQGEIPKQKDIIEQYEVSKLYRPRSMDYFILALNSIELFYGHDPLFPVIRSRADRLMVYEYDNDGEEDLYKLMVQKMSRTKGDLQYGLSYALAYSYEERQKGLNPVDGLLKYYGSVKNTKGMHSQIAPGVLQEAGDVQDELENKEDAKELYKQILQEYPNYYRTSEVKRKIGIIEFSTNKSKIPDYLIEIVNDDNSSRKDIKYVMEDIYDNLYKNNTKPEIRRLTDFYLKGQNLEGKSNELSGFLKYMQADLLEKENKFKESNTLIDSYLPALKKGSYVYLKSKLLKAENLRDLGDTVKSSLELLEFIENYDYDSGVVIKEEDIKRPMLFFEQRAREFEVNNKFKDAAISYQYIVRLLSLSKEKKLPIGKIYKDYSVFYQKKMVDSALEYANNLQESENRELFKKFNIPHKRRLDIWGDVTESLDGIFRAKIFKYFGDFRDLQFFSDLYDDDKLKVLDNYYKEILDSSRKSLDYATIYGYTYYLISKAVKEETYYLMEDALTESRKSEILQNLKQAEYDLGWIIYADPVYADAYLLLGWLYQYIDVRKKTFIPLENSLDGKVYESLYTKYFPMQYLEENIELYNQILEFLGKYENKKVLSDIHLNIANNYFLLSNFQKALFHYNKVEGLSRYVIDRVQFEDYKQKALYYFNFARSNIYASKYTKALKYFHKAVDIYYESEYFPILAKLGVKNDIPELREYMVDVKKKIALLHALIGLTEMELERYDDAIVSFSTSVSMNGDTDYINDMSLYNNLAFCYQEIGEYEKADEMLSLADEEYDAKSKKGFLDYFKYSIWDSVLPDNVRTIGPGRFPFGMTPEFSNLTTQGIRINILTDKKEFNQTAEAIHKRSKFIEENKLDKTQIGKQILDGDHAELGYNEFIRGNYYEADNLYTYDYTEQTEKKNYEQAYRSYLRSNIALFAHLEENPDNVKTVLEELVENIKFSKKFRDDTFKRCLESIDKTLKIKEEDLEDYCEKKFDETYYNFDPFLGYNYFYLGELYKQKKEYEVAFDYYGRALPLIKNPLGIEDDDIGLEGDKFSAKERARLKIITALIYYRLGELEKFEKQIAEAFYFSSEYQFERELLSIYQIQAEYFYKKGEKNYSSYSTALEYTNKAEENLKKNPGIIYDIDEIFLNSLYSLKSMILLKLKKYDEVVANREKLFSFIFFRQLLVNELKFQDKKIFETLNNIQLLVLEDKEYIGKIEQANEKSRNTAKIINEKEKNLKKIQESIKNYSKYIPVGIDVSSWTETSPKPIPILLEPNEILIQFFASGKYYTQMAFYKNSRSVQEFRIDDFDDPKEIEKHLASLLDSYTNIKKIVFVPSYKMYKMDFNGIKYKDKTLNDYFEIRYIFRSSQLEREVDFEYSRLKRITDVFPDIDKRDKSFWERTKSIFTLESKEEKKEIKEINLRNVSSEELKNYLTDTDILVGETDFSNRKHMIAEKKVGNIHIREVVENQWNIPLLIITNYKRTLDNFIKIGFLYDILQFAGVKSILLIEKEENSTRIKDKILSNIKNINKVLREEKVIIIGESISEYPEDQKLYENEFRKFTKRGIEEERKQEHLKSIRYLLQANSVLPDTKPDLLIESELNIARLKTKLFPVTDYLFYYKVILDKYLLASKEEEKVLYNMLLMCYEAKDDVDCKTYQERYDLHPLATDQKKFVLYYYKNLRIGNLNVIEPEYKKFISISTDEEPYLKNIKLAYLFSRGFVWDKAKYHAQKANELALSQREKEITHEMLSDIDFEIYFIKGIAPAPIYTNSVYYYAINRIWDIYKEKTQSIYKNQSDSFKKVYQSRIFDAYESLETSIDFEPVTLGPLYLKDGRPALNLLQETERNFLFFVLLSSLPYQTQDELNNQFDILLDTEFKLKNKNRTLWMQIQWSSSLYQRGDYPSSKKYFKDFEENFKGYYKEKDINKTYHLLKYKLSKIFEDVNFTTRERDFIYNNFRDWFSFYEKAEKSDSSNFIKLLDELIVSKNNQKIDLFNEKELFDFITFLQWRSLKQKDFIAFLDIGFAKEKFRSIDPKIYDRDIYFKDLGKVNSIAQNIQNKIPKNQVFTAMIDLGIQTYSIHIKQDKITGNVAYEDNREIKYAILDYLYTIKDSGASLIKHELIETQYRKHLKLEKGVINYLYLPSYHFKITLEPEEEDIFYYVLNPELMINRPIYDPNEDFQYGFGIDIKNKSRFSEVWWKKLKGLENFELRNLSGNRAGKKVTVSQEELSLEKGRIIQFGGSKLTDLSKFGRRQGPWIFTGSLLFQTSLHNDDLAFSFMYLDQIHFGPGIVSTGLQSDTNNVFFLKQFLEQRKVDYPFSERFIESFYKITNNYDDHKYWIGYKPYTNMFIGN